MPPVLHDAELPLAERMAARLDGELYTIGDGHSAIDEVDRPELRLQAVLGERPQRLIAELATAAWVWGARDCLPSRMEFCVDIQARARPPATALTVVREVVLIPEDVFRFGRNRLTTPLRTAVDLARTRVDFAAEDIDAARRLAVIGGFDLVDCRAYLNRGRNLPAKRRAQQRFTELVF